MGCCNNCVVAVVVVVSRLFFFFGREDMYLMFMHCAVFLVNDGVSMYVFKLLREAECVC